MSLGAINESVSAFTISGGVFTNGTLTASTYALNGGTVAGNLGAGIINVGGSTTLKGTEAAATVNVNSNGTLTMGGSSLLSSSASVAVTNGGVLNLNSNNETIAALTGNGIVTNTAGGMLTLNNGGSIDTFAGNIAGSGSLNLTGSGTLNLTGANTYSGTSKLNGGTLNITGGSLNTNGTVSVNSGATLAGTGTVGTVTLGSNAVIAPTALTASAPGTLTVSSLIINGGSTYDLSIGTNSSDLINSLGSITFNNTTNSGSTFTLALTNYGSAPSSSINFTILTGSSLSFTGGFNAAAFTINTNGFTGIGSWSLVTNSTSLLLDYYVSGGTNGWTNGSGNLSTIGITNNSTLVFAGGPSGTVTNNSNGSNTITSLTGINYSNSFTGSSTLTGLGVTLGSGGITNNSTNTQTVALPITLGTSQTFNAASNNLIISGNITNTGGYDLTITGAYNTTLAGNIIDALIKTGSGTLTVSGTDNSTTNLILGGTEVVTGVITNTSYIGVGDPGTNVTFIISGGGLVNVTNQGMQIGNNDSNYPSSPASSGNAVIVTGSGSSLSVTGGLEVGNDSNTVNNSVLANSNATLTADTITVGTYPGASSNSVTVTGSGSTLNSGAVTIGQDANGNNSLLVSSGAVMNSGYTVIGGYNLTTFGSSSNNSATLNGATWNLSNGLTVGDGSSGNSLTVSGGGTLSLTGTNGLFIGENSSGSVSPGSNNTVLLTGAGSLLTNSGNITIGVTGGGTLTVASGATLNTPSISLASSNNAVGTLNIGTLGGSDTGVTLNTTTIYFGTNGGTSTVNFNQADTEILSATLSGAGSFNQLGSGTTILTSTNNADNFTGTTLITNSGTLQVGNGSVNGSLGTGSVTIASGSSLVLDPGTSSILFISSPITGAGTLTSIGYQGYSVLTGNNSYSGGTVIGNVGTLRWVTAAQAAASAAGVSPCSPTSADPTPLTPPSSSTAAMRLRWATSSAATAT